MAGRAANWSQGEITTFLEEYKRHGAKWSTVAAALPGRSAADVEGLYRTHKHSLSTPGCTPELLYAVVTDVAAAHAGVDASDEPDGEAAGNGARPKRVIKKTAKLAPQESPAKGAAGGAAAVGAADGKAQQSPAKTNRRRRLFAEDGNGPPSPTPNTAAAGGPPPPQSPAPTPPPSRRMVGPAGTAGAAAGLDFEQPQIAAARKRGRSPDHDNHTKSRGRRTKPVVFGPGPHVTRPPIAVGSSFGSGISINPMQQRANALSLCLQTRCRAWVAAEWAYSAIDRGFFLRNEFEECLAEMRVPEGTQLTRAEWGMLRAAMGRPRRLSQNFLDEERGKLGRYREDVRLVQQNKKPEASLSDGPFVYQVPVQLQIGAHVSALHPTTRQLAMGTILTRDLARGQYRIQFDRADLGVPKVQDTDIIPHGPLQLLYPALASTSGSVAPVGFTPNDCWKVGNAVPTEFLHESDAPRVRSNHAAALQHAARNHQLKVMTAVQQLLERKALLVAELNRMNKETLAMQPPYPEPVRKGYTWLLQGLEFTNKALDNELRAMRQLNEHQGAQGADAPASSEKLTQQLETCDRNATVWLRKAFEANVPNSHVTDPFLNTNPKVGSVLRLATNATSCLLALQASSDTTLAPWERWALLDQAVGRLKPRFETNNVVFRELEDALSALRVPADA